MSENKLCPHCGSKMFMATITRGCVVEVTTDNDNPYKVLKESKDKYNIEILKCVRCKNEIKEEDLVGAVQCKQCGRLVTPADVDENGVCDVCNAMKQRTELANASKEDLVKMLLEAEKRTNPVAAKMVEKQTAATVTETTEDEVPTGFTLTPVEDTVAEQSTEPPKRPRARRKRTEEVNAEATPETIEETSVENTEDAPVEEESAVENLANQQDAPFPDMNLPEEMTETPVQTESEPVQEEQAVGADFRMFDDGDDAF